MDFARKKSHSNPRELVTKLLQLVEEIPRNQKAMVELILEDEDIYTIPEKEGVSTHFDSYVKLRDEILKPTPDYDRVIDLATEFKYVHEIKMRDWKKKGRPLSKDQIDKDRL